MGAKKKPQEQVSLSELGVEAGQAGEQGSATTVLALNEPPARGDSRRVEGDGAPAEIVAFLEEKRLV
jgi:electron transfer flavoprotein alpha/beta subunit